MSTRPESRQKQHEPVAPIWSGGTLVLLAEQTLEASEGLLLRKGPVLPELNGYEQNGIFAPRAKWPNSQAVNSVCKKVFLFNGPIQLLGWLFISAATAVTLLQQVFVNAGKDFPDGLPRSVDNARS